MKKLIAFCLAFLLVQSCNSAKVKGGGEAVSVENAAAFFNEIAKEDSFDALIIKSKIDVENGKAIPRLSATFYIENGQKVWANITALLGLVGARGEATPQGIQAYEKINKTYIDSDFTYLNKMLGISFLDYGSLQNLLLGRTFVPVSPEDFDLETTEKGYFLTSKEPMKMKVDGKTYAYDVQLGYDLALNLTRVEVNQLHADQRLTVAYGQWNTVSGIKVPGNVKILINSKKSSSIYIENTTFELSRMDAPFSIPSNYKKSEIK